MKRNHFLAVVLGALFIAAAAAAAYVEIHWSPALFKSTVTINGASTTTGITNTGTLSNTGAMYQRGPAVIDGGLNITGTLTLAGQSMTMHSGSIDYDFPALLPAATGYNCGWSNAIYVDGGSLGAACSVGINQSTATAALAEVTINCEATGANEAKVYVCNHSRDGGSPDLPDAGYTVVLLKP